MALAFTDTFYWIALINLDDAAHNRVAALDIARSVAANRNIRVIPQSHQSYLSGLELYASRLDKGFSLTDCIFNADHAPRRLERRSH